MYTYYYMRTITSIAAVCTGMGDQIVEIGYHQFVVRTMGIRFKEIRYFVSLGITDFKLFIYLIFK